MNKIDEIFSDSSNALEFSRNYFEYLATVLSKIDVYAIQSFIDLLLRARDEDRQIFFIGNGGSAATASHFANDIGVGTRSLDKPFRAVSLTDNNAVITAIANDDGYDQVFRYQLQIQMRPGDIVVAISASGNSPNVLSAINYAKEQGSTTVGLTGFDGGDLRQMVDLAIHVPTAKGEYGPVEDAHMVLDHLIGAYLMRYIVAADKACVVG